MAMWKIVYTKMVVDEEWIEADSYEEALDNFDSAPYREDGDAVFFVEDEDGNTID